MSSDLFQEKTDEQSPSRYRSMESFAEVAPSVLREDDLYFPRTVGMICGTLVLFIAAQLFFRWLGLGTIAFSLGWQIVSLAIGFAGLLFHAAFERNPEYRFGYFGMAYVFLVVGIFLCLLPVPKQIGEQFIYGIPCLGLALVFFLAVLRNEGDTPFRSVAELTLGTIGVTATILALAGSNLYLNFLLPYGLVLGAVGMTYLAAFVGTRGLGDDLAYWAGQGMAWAGALVVVLGIIFMFIYKDPLYFTTYGFLLSLMGGLYLMTGLLLTSEWTLMVLIRRELGAFFYSPIAYLVLFGFVLAIFIPWLQLLDAIFAPSRNVNVPGPLEPIVQQYFFNLFPVFVLIFAVPALTMRLLSEELRAGTLEVMLTAPVGEFSLVLSKYIAALIFFLVSWSPFWLYLLTLPLAGAKPFDYRPLLSFLIALTVTGAGFVGMGLLCSSLTKNQIASGVICFTGMVLLTFMLFLPELIRGRELGSWPQIFEHMSYLHLYRQSLEGRLVPGNLLFFLSLGIFSLFLTVKVMEIRRWA